MIWSSIWSNTMSHPKLCALVGLLCGNFVISCAIVGGLPFMLCGVTVVLLVLSIFVSEGTTSCDTVEIGIYGSLANGNGVVIMWSVFCHYI